MTHAEGFMGCMEMCIYGC